MWLFSGFVSAAHYEQSSPVSGILNKNNKATTYTVPTTEVLELILPTKWIMKALLFVVAEKDLTRT